MLAASRFATLASSAALAALSFNAATALAGGLYENSRAINSYSPALSIQIRKAAGDDLAGGEARGFMIALEYGLCRADGKSEVDCKREWRGAADDIADSPDFGKKPKTVVYPQVTSTNMLAVAGVVPPKALESSPIPVCAEQNNKVLGTWKITADGNVVADAWNGAASGAKYTDGTTDPACKAYIQARKAEFNQQLAELEKLPQKPVIVAAADGLTAANAARQPSRSVPGLTQ